MKIFITKVLVIIFCNYSPLIAQILDFENLEGVKVGDEVSTFSTGETCTINFFISADFKTKSPFYLQKVGVKSSATFQGVRNGTDCEGFSIATNRFNTMNSNGYKLNSSYTNRERVGCQFISAILEGNNMPSVFIQYSVGTFKCSGDILDVDGANNAIEAYDIYYYKSIADYPDNPILSEPLKIRTSGPSFGNGEIGDDGGIEHFEIVSSSLFKLIEIRPNQQPNPKNKIRTIFGFALDNFSPCENEKSPFTPPYLTTEKKSDSVIEDVYFGFDKSALKVKEQNKLDELVNFWKKDKTKTIVLTAYTDPKGSNEYNIKLSKKRVETVKNYLVMNGVSNENIQTFYKGEEYQDNQEHPDWKKRKVAIVLK